MTTHNPYTPPDAPVTDPVYPAMAMPREVNLAVWLIWVSLALGIVSFVIEPATRGTHFGTAGDDQLRVFYVVMLIMMCLMLGLVVLLAVCIRRAHRWARIVYSAVVVINLLGLLRGVVPDDFARPWYYEAIYLVTKGMDIATVVLLFMPAANTWFSKRREAAPS